MSRWKFAASLAAGLWACAPVVAAESVMVERNGDWATYVRGEGEARECWASSQPSRSEASRKNVRRGDIFLTARIQPSEDVFNEVSFRSGYPFDKGSQVSVRIGNEEVTMFTEGENAWPEGEPEDEQLVEAFRRGVRAVVRGVSSRGTRTTDTFSLIGFTKAVERSMAVCSQVQ